MTFLSSLAILSLLWTGVCLSILNRKYGLPPSIILEPKPAYCSLPACDIGDTVTIYFKVEEKIRIRCNASGRPDVKYKWTKDNLDFDTESPRVSVENGKGTLRITNASKADNGIYQCFATNTKGTALSKKANVVMTINDVFKSVIRPERRDVNEGMPLSLKCKQPHVVPKPNVYWTFVEEYSTAQPPIIPNDKRVAIDYEGTLHFANVKKSDVKGEGKFVCNMHNGVYRTSSEGEDKIVNIISSESVNGVSLLWRSDASVLGLKNGKAKFMCIFAGKATPDIVWKRKGGIKLNSRMKVSEHGQELIIEDLEFADKGEYECSATNDVTSTPVVATFTLQVEARPYFVKEPIDVTIGVEENAEFFCMVEGIPAPDVNWFINGQPINDAPPNPRRTIQKDRLVFKNVTDGDSQVIQCKAANKHGSLMADVYLNVLALKALVTDGPGKVKVAEGNSVTLKCEHNGKPDPALKWMKNNVQPLNTDRYEFTHNTVLIKDVLKKDNGKYTCISSNRFGSDNKTGELIVRKKTKVTLRPVERSLAYGEGAIFNCLATSDPSEQQFLEKLWFKNGVRINNNDDDGNIQILENGDTLSIVKTSSKDSANYSCVADNKVDSDTGESQLKVKAPPDPPRDLTIKTCGNLKVTLFWRPGFDNYMPISNYVIYSKTNYDNAYKKINETIGTVSEYEQRLSAYANYTFQIKARNQLGESVFSNITPICSTKAAIPEQHPTNVRIVENMTGKLVIEWDPVEPINQNGPDFKYVIITQDKAGNKKSYEVTDWKTTRKEIDVNNIYKEYKVQVKAVNSKGEAAIPPLVYTGHSGMGVPTVVPGNFEVDPDAPYTHETIGLRWDAVDMSEETMQGKFDGYKIRYWHMDQPDKVKEIQVEVPGTNKKGRRKRRQATAESKIRRTVRLPPNADLQLDVVARNTYLDSNGSNKINITTPEGVPGPVQSLESMYRSGHFVKIKWEKPKEENGKIVGYDIEYEEIIGLGVDKESIPVQSVPEWVAERKQYEFGVPGLELNTNYRIKVWAKTKTGRGDIEFVDVKTAAENMPTVPLIVDALPAKTSINVTWQINKGDVAGYHYFVEYRKYGEHKFQSGPPEKRNTWSVINNLTSGSSYEVKVVAESGKFKARSEIRLVTTAKTDEVASAVYNAEWFIIMMVVLALLILILFIVCLVKRSRGDKYHVQEKEKLRGLENDEKKTAQYNGFNDNGETQPLAGSPDDYDKGPLESDKDSLEEYADPDPSRFNEDGSFIGQYGAEKMTASDVAAPSAMHTFV
ncbi:neuroglian-like isoform X2 [Mytilus galloprovincialis]|uniref:neuroglian-like isoform X2 n=1 Tax=Mytilus galloprovincialis TaxID=29158 RepID=UPI003F7B4240